MIIIDNGYAGSEFVEEKPKRTNLFSLKKEVNDIREDISDLASYLDKVYKSTHTTINFGLEKKSFRKSQIERNFLIAWCIFNTLLTIAIYLWVRGFLG